MKVSKNIMLLNIVSIFRGFGVAAIRTFLPVMAFTVGMSMKDIGIMVTIATTTGVLFALFVGYIVDAMSKRIGLLLSNTAMFVAPLLVSLIPSPTTIAIAYVLFMLSFFSWQSARGAIVYVYAYESYGSTIATMATLFQISRTASPYVTGIAIASLGYSKTFIAIATLLAIPVALSLLIEEPKRDREGVSLLDMLRRFKPRRDEVPLYTVLILDRFGWSLWLAILNPMLKDAYSIGEEMIGLLNTLMSISTLVMMPIAGMLTDRRGWYASLMLSELTVFATILLLLYGEIVHIALGFIAMGISIAFWIPAYNTAIARRSSGDNIGIAFSKANIFRVLPSIPAPSIGGWLYTISITAPLIFGAISISLCIASLLLLRRYLS